MKSQVIQLHASGKPGTSHHLVLTSNHQHCHGSIQDHPKQMISFQYSLRRSIAVDYPYHNAYIIHLTSSHHLGIYHLTSSQEEG